MVPVVRLVSLLSVGCACVALGCGTASETDAAVAAAPPAGADVVFDREGVPGPWWRRGATMEMFEDSLGGCLARGREARSGAADPADAAYRGFLECMKQHSWVRGLPPGPTARAQ